MASLTHSPDSFSPALCPSLRDGDNSILLVTEKEIEHQGEKEVNERKAIPVNLLGNSLWVFSHRIRL